MDLKTDEGVAVMTYQSIERLTSPKSANPALRLNG